MPRSMLSALALAIGQIGDPRVLRILAKSLAITIAIFIVAGAASWWGLNWLLEMTGIDTTLGAYAEELRGFVSLVAVIIGGWLLWRVVALAVLQFFADDMVEVVEAKHYPQALLSARRIGLHDELRIGMRSAGRAIFFNLIALPFALVLLVTGIGPALLFWAVNSVLIGRELTDMVWLRHSPSPDATQPVGPIQRLVLGGIVTALLAVPFANLLAPFIGAAAATHLVHRKGTLAHAA